jgi:hypothetical protein
MVAHVEVIQLANEGYQVIGSATETNAVLATPQSNVPYAPRYQMTNTTCDESTASIATMVQAVFLCLRMVRGKHRSTERI